MRLFLLSVFCLCLGILWTNPTKAQFYADIYTRDTAGMYIDSGIICLLKYNAISQTFSVYDCDTPGMGLGSGYFNVDTADSGIYTAWVRTISPPGYEPTYLDSTIWWSKASKFHLNPDSPFSYHYVYVQPTNLPPTGNATISGKMKKGQNWAGKIAGPGDPYNGIDVSLIDKSDSKPIAHDITHTQGIDTGVFEFQNVPPGQYWLYCNVPGIGSDSNWTVNVSGSETISDIIIYADTVYGFHYLFESVEEPNNDFALKVFPNPSRDWLNVSYSVAQPTELRITLYTLTGERVAILLDQAVKAGQHAHSINLSQLEQSANLLLQVEIGEETYTKSIIQLE